jgi:hypothetical protein
MTAAPSISIAEAPGLLLGRGTGFTLKAFKDAVRAVTPRGRPWRRRSAARGLHAVREARREYDIWEGL